MAKLLYGAPPESCSYWDILPKPPKELHLEPRGRRNNGEELIRVDDKVDIDDSIEMICPIDIGTEANGVTLTGIPDIILGTIITKISERSKNIVSIPLKIYLNPD